MKKIWIAVFCLFCIVCNIKTVNGLEVKKEGTGVFTTKTLVNGHTISAELYQLSVDGKVAYCIEPGRVMQGDGYIETPNFENFGIGESLRKEIERITYYGYTYIGHDKIEYYMATQWIIWEKLGSYNITFYKDGNPLDLSPYKKEIEDLVKTHDILPSFAGKEYTHKVGEKIDLMDENHVLERYELVSGSGIIKENRFSTEGPIEQEEIIRFKQKKRSGVSLLYYSDVSQRMGVFTLSDEESKTFDFKILWKLPKGIIEITKTDLGTGEGLAGATFGIYNEKDEILQQGITSETGQLIFQELPYGIYYVKEIKAPKGYIQDLEPIEIKLNREKYIAKVHNQKYEMPVTSDIDKIYQNGPTLFTLIGISLLYAYKKTS